MPDDQADKTSSAQAAEPTGQARGREVLPKFLYGTAWKEKETERLTELAIEQGFRGIDTANQRKHYYEAAVGQGIANVIKAGIVRRDELFLQTKFTFRHGQDHRLPYDPKAPIATQVQQSLASSLEHLQTDFVDSYVLHGPMQRSGLTADDWAAWRAMELLHDQGQIRELGISNVALDQLQLLVEQARIKPLFVQNRCYAIRGWDAKIRAFCRSHGIVYQGFSLLTANAEAIARREMIAIAKRYDRTVNQIVFRFAIDVGMLPLTGTTKANHMREDLAILDFQLQPHEVSMIEKLAVP
jgi:diketogulonate reductase-like aldo/keto reductase